MRSLMKRLVSKAKGRRIHRPEIVKPYTYLGSEYGGWPIIGEQIAPESVVWSFGLGTDVSFDVAIMERFKCRVVGFDPTPKCIEWLSKQSLPQLFTYHQMGISSSDGEAEFFPPVDDGHVSFSSQSSGTRGGQPIKAPVRRLSTLLREFNTQRIDVLKMDVEGFEYAVIEDILATAVRPPQLLIEFHHTMYGIEPSQTRTAVKDLQRAGYKIFYVSDVGLEYGFFLSE